MAINVADNFSYKGSKPLDARTQYATVAAMKAAAEADLSDGLRCYVKEDKKNYIFDSTNTVDSTTGKWRELESGGSGVTNYNDLENRPQIEGVTLSGNKTASDLGLAKANQIPTVPTKVSQLQNDSGFITNSALPGVYAGNTAGLVPAAGSDNEGKYLDNDGNWTVVPMPMIGTINRSDIYDTTEKVTGKWTDGRPVYQKTIVCDAMVKNNNIWQSKTNHNISNVDKWVSVDVIGNASGGTAVSSVYFAMDNSTGQPNGSYLYHYIDSSKLWLYSATDRSTMTFYAILKYTKTTDAANSYNYADENDYSTSEKIIGKWISGETLYQKTIETTTPNCTTDGFSGSSYVSIGATIDNVADLQVVYKSSVGFIATTPHIDTVPILADSNYRLKALRVFVYNNSVSSNKNTIRIDNSNTAYNNATLYVTIKYTKA